MLLTVVVLSATILGATTIAGLLTMYQVRQTADIINSAKAIFAADAGLECAYYAIKPPASCKDSFLANCKNITFDDNGASFTATITQEWSTSTPSCIIRSTGEAGTAIRAFEAEL